ncbi:MAG: signal transduction histidine kinase [Cellvibrionaceae bacterium]|jgi:signal transduction histidine kinase
MVAKVTNLDIARQEMLVNKLRAVLGRMEIATMLSSDAMVWSDERGVAQWCNSAFEDLINIPRYEILGAEIVKLLVLYKDKKLVRAEDHPINSTLVNKTHKIEQYVCQLGENRTHLEIAQAPTIDGDEQTNAVLVLREVNKSAPMNLPKGLLETAIKDRLKTLTYKNMELERKVETLSHEVEEQRFKAMDTMEAGYRAKSAFLANMTHEFRTPLSAIMGYADILGREVKSMGHEDWARDLLEIRNASNQLFFMINQLLDMAAIEEDQSAVTVAEVEVASIIREVKSSILEVISEQDNQLSVTVSPKVDVMRTDVAKLRKTLVNLLNNAAKFTIDGEVSLDVTALTQDGVEFVRFVVRDTGAGMNEDQVARIFDPFTQADESLTRSYEGSGLGLYISSQFVEKMGGTIVVTHSEPGNGSEFEVLLPKEMPSLKTNS